MSKRKIAGISVVLLLVLIVVTVLLSKMVSGRNTNVLSSTLNNQETIVETGISQTSSQSTSSITQVNSSISSVTKESPISKTTTSYATQRTNSSQTSSTSEAKSYYLFVDNNNTWLMAISQITYPEAIKNLKSAGLPVPNAPLTTADLPSPLKAPNGTTIILQTTAQTKFTSFDFTNMPLSNRKNIILTIIPDFPIDNFDVMSVKGVWFLHNT